MEDWMLDKGIWIILTILLTAAALFLSRRLLGVAVRRVMARLDAYEILRGIAQRTALVRRILETPLDLAIVLAALLAILAVLEVDISGVVAALKAAGVTVGQWLGSHGVRIALIVGIIWALYRLLRRAVPRLIEYVVIQDKGDLEREETLKRAQTLSAVATGSGGVVLLIAGAFMVLAELGMNIAPILAGVGIAGIAIGFGAQHLVRDIISGVFILMEDQYRKGDVASVGGKTGLVEDVNLRRTVLRDLDGIVHVIPNGEVTVSSNYTKGFSRVNLDVSVAYKEDLDQVFGVLNRVGQELAQDEYFRPLIIEAPQVVRVSAFEDSGIAIKMLGVTRPIRQWEVTGELRKRIKKAFDQEGIEIPFPHRTVYWGVGAHPLSGDTLEPTSHDREREIRNALRRTTRRSQRPPQEGPPTS